MTLKVATPWMMVGGTLKRRTVSTGPPPPPPPVIDRDTLVYGTYKPNTPDVVGLLPDVALDPVYPTSGNVISIVSSATPIVNKMFWGQVDLTGSITQEFWNCHGVGMDPAVPTASGSLTGNFNLISGPRVIFRDCLISSAPWVYTGSGPGAHPDRPLAPTALRQISPNSAGIHGGNFDAFRTEITDVQDGVNYTTGAGTRCLMQGCWIHRMWYENGWTGPGAPISQDTHSDVFQTNRGKDITLRHNMLGGPRVPAAYYLPAGTGYNAGDDARGAILMIGQEVSVGPNDLVENVLIEENWIGGGEQGVHIPYKSNLPNTFPTTIVRNNKFLQRQAGDGWYIYKHSQIQATITGNTIEGTGTPAPIFIP